MRFVGLIILPLLVAMIGLGAGLARQTEASGAIVFEVGLSGYEVVPPVLGAPSSNGIARFTYMRSTNELSYDLSVYGVPDQVTGAALYNAMAGANGPLVRVLTQTAPDHFAGAVVLTEAEAAELRAGRIYLSVASAGRPEGVARGQLFVPEPTVVCVPSPLGKIKDDDPKVVVVYVSLCHVVKDDG